MKLDGVFTLGEHTKHTNNALDASIHNEHFNDKNAMIESLKEIINPGDKILFKGSRGMKMEKVIEGVFKS